MKNKLIGWKLYAYITGLIAAIALITICSIAKAESPNPCTTWGISCAKHAKHLAQVEMALKVNDLDQKMFPDADSCLSGLALIIQAARIINAQLVAIELEELEAPQINAVQFKSQWAAPYWWPTSIYKDGTLYIYLPYRVAVGRYRTMDKWLRNKYIYDLREFYLVEELRD